ncbi:Gag-polypeptide of LTR copia-type, partial [Sesbania bispinosa]
MAKTFIQWARSVRIFLQGKGKAGYISGDSKEPEKGDSNLLQKTTSANHANIRKNGGYNNSSTK